MIYTSFFGPWTWYHSRTRWPFAPSPHLEAQQNRALSYHPIFPSEFECWSLGHTLRRLQRGPSQCKIVTSHQRIVSWLMLLVATLQFVDCRKMSWSFLSNDCNFFLSGFSYDFVCNAMSFLWWQIFSEFRVKLSIRKFSTLEWEEDPLPSPCSSGLSPEILFNFSRPANEPKFGFPIFPDCLTI